LLAAASTDFGADLYNHETGQLLHTFSANAGPVASLGFSPNGDTLMVAWADGVVHLYNAFTMELRREFLTPAAFLETAVYSPDGKFILTGEGWPFFTATIWDARTTQRLRAFQGHKWNVSSVAFSRDGTSILTGAEVVREWSMTSVLARLGVERLPDQLRLTWLLGELQHATHAQGPWQTLTNASPFTSPLSGDMGFYRVHVNASE
jgi:WD40 repeat protein